MMGVPTRNHDRCATPLIPCESCGEVYRYSNYWTPRYVEGVENPRSIAWFCDDCTEEMYATAERLRRARRHKTLEEWSE